MPDRPEASPATATATVTATATATATGSGSGTGKAKAAATAVAWAWVFAAGLSAAGQAAAAASTDPYRAITVVSWGGPYELSQVKAYFEPFTRATGIRIDLERYDGGLDELRRQVSGGDVDWDLMDMTMADNRAACRQGLLEPIDHSRLHPAPDGTPAEQDFIDGALTECGVAQIVYAMVAAYNRDAFPGERPARIADIFDLGRFPGTRALQRGPEANLEWALRSYGVPRQDLYQLLSTERGLRLAFERLDRIRDHVVWWTSVEQPVDMLISGEAVIASEYNGRAVRRGRRSGASHRDHLGRAGLRARLVGDPPGHPASRRRARVHPLRDGDRAPRRTGEVHRLRAGAPVLDEARVHACGDGGGHASPPAHEPDELPDRDPQGHRVVREPLRPDQGPLRRLARRVAGTRAYSRQWSRKRIRFE